MKHLIFTRFYCANFGILKNDDIFSEKILTAGYININKFLLPSLENQTNKNFTLIIDIHPQLKNKNKEIFDKMYAIKDLNYSFDIEIIEHNRLEEYVDSLNETFLIETRIDADDSIFNKAVETLQQQFDENIDFKFYAFMKGSTQCINNLYELHEFISPKYDGFSSLGIFPTIFVNWKKYRQLPYYDHTKVKMLFKQNNIEIKPNINHIYNYDEYNAWIYNQHGTNTTFHADGTQKHKSDKIIIISKDEIKERFGI